MKLRGVEQKDDHLVIDIAGVVSRFHYLWLRDNSPDSHTVNGQKLHETNLLDPNILRAWLSDVASHGFGLLREVPAIEEKIFDVVELFGFVRDTNYGKLCRAGESIGERHFQGCYADRDGLLSTRNVLERDDARAVS